MRILPVADDQWGVVAWLWQAFRQDLAPVVHALPYADGRYQARTLDAFPGPDGAGYLAWQPHPVTGEEAPVGFALVSGLTGERRMLAALWVATAVRRTGAGRELALDVLARHDGPWTVAWQHDNEAAGCFWRRVATDAFGAEGWTEQVRAVPNRPQVPPDHWIESA